MTQRNEILKELGGNSPPWDVLVIGGGATGLGAAVEAASRGYRTLLVERSDFAKETSSRSTKLVHGGVRYLQQMNVTLVLDALSERGHMLRNAPHLVHDLNFVIPAYSYFSLPYYGVGLKIYERLSGKLSFGHSQVLSRKTALEKLPGVKSEGLRGGILYHDGQFDDARYAIALLRTLEDLGGVAINYVEATGLIERDGKVIGIRAHDKEDGAEFELQAKAVVNAYRRSRRTNHRDGRPAAQVAARHQPGIAFRFAAQLPARRYRVDDSQNRRRARALCHSLAWRVARRHHRCAVDSTSPEPRALPQEKAFLRDAHRPLHGHAPRPEEILSVFSGLRPLVRKGHAKTSKLSRDHTILVSPAGLITVTGGKWTTYRRMGQDTIDRAAQVAGLQDESFENAGAETARLGTRADHRELRVGARLRLRSARACRRFRAKMRVFALCCTRACHSVAARWCGRRAMRWRGLSRTCSRGAPARSFSMPAPPSKPRPQSPIFWRASSAAATIGS